MDSGKHDLTRNAFACYLNEHLHDLEDDLNVFNVNVFHPRSKGLYAFKENL
jgi:hypothetical protein